MPLIEGYGLTEAGVLCLNPLGHPRAGSIGKPLPGVKLRTAEDGELQVLDAVPVRGVLQGSKPRRGRS